MSIGKKNINAYDHLLDWTHSVDALYPRLRIHNPFNRLAHHLQDQETEVILLLEKLITSLTRLNHLHRVCDQRGRYVSCREDVVSALYLLQHLLNPTLQLTPAQQSFYRSLCRLFANTPFSRKQIQQALLESKTHTQRQLNRLVAAGLLHREGYPNRGYRYRVRQGREKNDAPLQ